MGEDLDSELWRPWHAVQWCNLHMFPSMSSSSVAMISGIFWVLAMLALLSLAAMVQKSCKLLGESVSAMDFCPVWFWLRSFRDLDIRHVWKSVERWVFGEAFPRSLHPSVGPWVSSLRAAYWQSSTWSTGSFQSKHFRLVNLRACEVEIPLFICLAQHSRREQGSWYGGVCTTVAGRRASTASATGQLRIKTLMFFFARKLLNASDSSDKWFKVWSHRLESTVLFEHLFYQHHASYFVPLQDPGAGSQNWCLFSSLTQTYGSLPLPSLSRCPSTNPFWKFWKFQDSIFNPSWEKQRTQSLVICLGQLVSCWTISLRFS